MLSLGTLHVASFIRVTLGMAGGIVLGSALTLAMAAVSF